MSAEEFPWWTPEELQQFGNEYEEYFANHPEVDFKPYYDLERSIGYTGANIRYVYFKK